MTQLIIDRLEENMAVIEYETGKTFSVPRFLLPEEAQEGDVLTRITPLSALPS